MGIIKKAEEVLFPSFCAGCKKGTPEEPEGLRWLCLDCHGLLAPHWQKAAYKPELDESYFIFDYKKDKLAKNLIRALKYNFVKEIGKTFGVALEKECVNIKKLGCDLIVPIPLHKKRLRERGFNQSALVAQKIGEILEKPVAENILKRKAYRRPQAEIKKRAKRGENIKGTFECANEFCTTIKGKTILLVDDVATTGATLKECARVLKNAGAAKVLSFTLAQD